MGSLMIIVCVCGWVYTGLVGMEHMGTAGVSPGGLVMVGNSASVMVYRGGCGGADLESWFVRLVVFGKRDGFNLALCPDSLCIG